MVLSHSMPERCTPSPSLRRDECLRGFDHPDWEWNHHPRKNSFRKTSRSLTLYAQAPLEKGNLLKAGGTLTLRAWQTPFNEVTVRLNTHAMAEGQRSGLCHLTQHWSEFGVEMKEGRRCLYVRDADGFCTTILVDAPSTLWLRTVWGLEGQARYLFSTDGRRWTDTGILYQMQWAFYRGDRIGLFTYNDRASEGSAELAPAMSSAAERRAKVNDRTHSGSATFTRFCYRCSDEMPVTNPFGKALVPDMIADASIEEIDGTFYCYATTDGYGRGLETSGPPTLWTSRDFVHWSFDGTYFPQAATEKYWAPSKAVPYSDKWYICPTVNGYMYPAVADSPEGPFEIAKGDSFTVNSRLWEVDRVHAIDAEYFIDDDGIPYVFWGNRNVARLKDDMVTIDSLFNPIPTRRTEYSEGPIFFKRKGIYYYLYTIGGDEHYEYYYQMSRQSPLGPWITPEHDLVCTTNTLTGVFGPGHGSVFNVEGTDDWFLAFLEFGRNSTNRMTYVNPLRFNDDGTIRQVDVNLEGTGYLHSSVKPVPLKVKQVTASSVAQRHKIRCFKDWRCQRTEQFVPQFAVDGENGSRWMAADDDPMPSLTVDLGRRKQVTSSEVAFVRPTEGHAYRLEASRNGHNWMVVGGHDDVRRCSPHVDSLDVRARYLRITLTEGVKGIYEWMLY
jgi:beta-xylosidase